MVSYGQDLDDFFLIFLQKIVLGCIIKYLLFFVILSYVLFMCIYKVGAVIDTVHGIDMVIRVNKSDWVQFRFMMYKCRFWRTRSWCINILAEVFGSWYIFCFFWWSCYLDAFHLIDNGSLKVHVSNLPSCFMSVCW